MNKYLEFLGIDIKADDTIQSLIFKELTAEQLLSFFIVNRAFMDVTSPNIEAHWRSSGARFINSKDCEAYVSDFSPNPESFMKKIRELIALNTKSEAGAKYMDFS